MRRKRLMGLAVMALALAGLVTLLAMRGLRRGGGAHAPRLATVMAATAPLAAGTLLKASDLKPLALPPDALPQHVFAKPGDLAGRVLLAAVVPNQVIVGEMVAAPGAGVGLPPLIPPGMRAVSVKVNDVVSVAGFAVPGTHVDVLLTGNPNGGNDAAKVTTITLLSNVQVLTAGQQMEQSPNGKPEKVTVITLLVDPAGAEKLALADGYGHIQLALRNPLDRLATHAVPLLNGSLYAGSSPRRAPVRVRRGPPPAAADPPAAPATWAVEVISGGKEQIVNFPVASSLGGHA